MKKCKDGIKVMLVGEGGQGVQTVAKLLARATFNKGYHSTYIPNFGTEQRGGISISFVKISKKEIVSPKFKFADIFIILTSRNIERTLRYISRDTKVLYDKYLVSKNVLSEISKMTTHTTPVEAFKTATEQMTERNFNIIILGTLTKLVDPDTSDNVLSLMDQKFEKYYKKRPELKDLNHKAFNIGFNLNELPS